LSSQTRSKLIKTVEDKTHGELSDKVSRQIYYGVQHNLVKKK